MKLGRAERWMDCSQVCDLLFEESRRELKSLSYDISLCYAKQFILQILESLVLGICEWVHSCILDKNCEGDSESVECLQISRSEMCLQDDTMWKDWIAQCLKRFCKVLQRSMLPMTLIQHKQYVNFKAEYECKVLVNVQWASHACQTSVEAISHIWVSIYHWQSPECLPTDNLSKISKTTSTLVTYSKPIYRKNNAWPV